MQIQLGNIKLSTRHLLGDGSTCLAHQQQQLHASSPRLLAPTSTWGWPTVLAVYGQQRWL